MGCNNCECNGELGFEIQMAFQPIVDVVKREVYSYEALVRGMNGESAYSILSQVSEENKYRFDQLCRVTAIETMAKLDNSARVNINFLPNAIYDPETCSRRTLAAAQKYGFPHENIIFEVTEHEEVENYDLLKSIFETYHGKGFKAAIDDFGEGYAGLNLLAEFQPSLLKLDMKLIQGIATDRVKQSILAGTLVTARSLGIEIIAEGIETEEDYRCLCEHGVELMQGYYFAKPAIGALPQVDSALF
jgi:EAL domain-containing protein (putative c-di-GMP-specific phosphodiesterase class I)